MVSIRSFSPPASNNRDVSDLARELERCFSTLETFYPGIAVICAGKLVEARSLVGPATDNVVYHNLGRAAVGFIKVNSSAAFDVYQSPTANPQSGSSLILRTNSAATVSCTLWVF